MYINEPNVDLLEMYIIFFYDFRVMKGAWNLQEVTLLVFTLPVLLGLFYTLVKMIFYQCLQFPYLMI